MPRRKKEESRAFIAEKHHLEVKDIDDPDAHVRGEIVQYQPPTDTTPAEATIINAQHPTPYIDEANVRERERQALALKMGGASYPSIAKTLGYAGKSGAYQAVKRAMAAIVTPDAELMRDLQSARIEHMILLLWPDVNKKDLASMAMARALIGDLRQMHGLDDPTKLQVEETFEGVLHIGGTKDDYLGQMRKVREAIKAASQEVPLDTEEHINGNAGIGQDEVAKVDPQNVRVQDIGEAGQ